MGAWGRRKMSLPVRPIKVLAGFSDSLQSYRTPTHPM